MSLTLSLLSCAVIDLILEDAVQRMLRLSNQAEGDRGQGPRDVRTETNFAARKF